MITIYYSNKLECLKEILVDLFFVHGSDNPLISEFILSENTPMIEWLYLELAKRFDISGNFEFFSIFDFIYCIFSKSLWNIFPKEIVSHSTMSWMLMKIISNINNDLNVTADWSTVKEYLRNDVDKYKCFQLSEKIGNLFFQYFLYKQDWFFQWEKKKLVKELDLYTQTWQSELWRLFLKKINNHGKKKSLHYFQYNIYEYIINILSKKNINLISLPKRIFIYGISYFPPILLEILQALGQYIDIYIFCINPCQFFIKKNLNYYNILRIDNSKFQHFFKKGSLNVFNRKLSLSSYNKTYINIGNILLSSWGKLFQETYYSLLQLKIIDEVNIFVKNIENISLLYMLQNDILNDHSQIDDSIIVGASVKDVKLNIKQRLLYPNDYSLTVHVCHSVQREVEVLYNNLLTIMSDNLLLLPNEIIVMAPNIDDYVSTIRSVFASGSIHGRYLPFNIFNSSVVNVNAIISSFFQLLKLPNIRFSVEEVLKFLEIPSLAACFKIDEEGLKLLNKWILKSGIRWGLDDSIFSDFMMFSGKNAQHTWEFGVTRMLLSYAIDDKSEPWNNIFPYDILDSNNISSINLVGQLSYFLKTIKYWKYKLSKSYTLKEWLPIVKEMINDFYVSDFDMDTKSSLILLENAWREIIVSGMEADYDESIPINILNSKLYDKLNRRKIKNRLFSGGITFCNLNSIRSIPFKVIYLLGMNVGIYPNINKVSLNFDLMKNMVHFDDYVFWNERYLFLEILLSARERIYISFIGSSLRNSTFSYPSILVTELFEYIAQNFYFLQEGTGIILKLTMDWIYEHLWYWHSNTVFSLENFISGSRNQSFFKEWLVFFNSNNISRNYHKPLFYSLLISSISVDMVSLDNLRNFYIHPVRAWFQKRLKIYFSRMLEISLNESFVLEIPVQYQIGEDLIFSFLNKKDINSLYQRIRCSGLLPYGSFGDLLWKKQCSIMMELSHIISQYYLPANRYNLKVFLTLNNVQLYGILHSVQKNGLLRWKPRVLSIQDGLLLWLEHLIYCAIGGEGDSWMFGINSSWHFSSLSHVEAKEYLIFLMFGYLDGMNIPLLLFNRSGGAWLRHCFDFEKKNISLDLSFEYKARSKLIEAWEGNCYIYGDSHDPYVRKLIPELREEDIQSIILAAKNYFLFPMQFNILN